MALVMGIGIGTYEAKGVLVDEYGQVVASAVRRHKLSVPRPGFAEHDAEEVWWGGLLAVVRDLLAAESVNPADVAALCCSGIGPCVLPVDAAGRPLRPAILYGVDTRASTQIQDLNHALGGDFIFARSGNSLSAQSAGSKIAWVRGNEQEIWASARWFVTCQSFLVGRLTGEWVIDHGTAGCFHPLYNIKECGWDIGGCESGVRREKLPEIRWAGEIAGMITEEASAACGLPVGTRVLVTAQRFRGSVEQWSL